MSKQDWSGRKGQVSRRGEMVVERDGIGDLVAEASPLPLSMSWHTLEMLPGPPPEVPINVVEGELYGSFMVGWRHFWEESKW